MSLFTGSIASNPNAGFTVNRGGWSSFDTYPRQLADVNGDGRDDIVGFGFDSVFVSLSNGDGTFTGSIASNPDAGFTLNRGGWSSFDTYPRLLGDVSGDGRGDIVGFGIDSVFVSLAI